MARIAKSDHEKIRVMVEVEEQKIPAVAKQFGCTPANVYAILNKLRLKDRKDSGGSRSRDISAPEPEDAVAAPAGEGIPSPVAAGDANVEDLFTAAALPVLAPVAKPVPASRPTRVPAPTPTHAPAPAASNAEPVSAAVPFDRAARGRSAEKGGVGTKLAKPGYAFHMRTAEGEESLTPYRSLEDLLSAVKGVLRTAARSPDPVWFSVQPIDLSTIDSEAA